MDYLLESQQILNQKKKFVPVDKVRRAQDSFMLKGKRLEKAQYKFEDEDATSSD